MGCGGCRESMGDMQGLYLIIGCCSRGIIGKDDDLGEGMKHPPYLKSKESPTSTTQTQAEQRSHGPSRLPPPSPSNPPIAPPLPLPKAGRSLAGLSPRPP